MARNFGIVRPDTGWDEDDWDLHVLGKDRKMKFKWFCFGAASMFITLWLIGAYLGY